MIYKGVRRYFFGKAAAWLMSIFLAALRGYSDLSASFYLVIFSAVVTGLFEIICVYQLKLCNERLRFLFGTTVVYNLFYWCFIFTGVQELNYPVGILGFFNFYLLFFGLSALAKQNEMPKVARGFKRMFFFVLLIAPVCVLVIAVFIVVYINPPIFLDYLNKNLILFGWPLYALTLYELYLVRKLCKGIQAREERQKKSKKKKAMTDADRLL